LFDSTNIMTSTATLLNPTNVVWLLSEGELDHNAAKERFGLKSEKSVVCLINYVKYHGQTNKNQ